MRAWSETCRFRAASPGGPCGIDSGVWGFAFEKPWKGVTAPALKRGGDAACCASGAVALASGGLRSAWEKGGGRGHPRYGFFQKIIIITISWGRPINLTSKRGNGNYNNSLSK